MLRLLIGKEANDLLSLNIQ